MAQTRRPPLGPCAIERCARPFHQDLLKLFDDFYDKVEDALFDLADKAERDDLYAGYFRAVRLFRRHRHTCRDGFLQALGAASMGLANAQPRDGQARAGRADAGASLAYGQTFANSVDLEEGLAISNLVSKSTNRYREVLSELNRHLAERCGCEGLTPDNNPLAPAAIGEAFLAAMQPFSPVAPAIRLVVYKLFDKRVMDRLAEPYARCVLRAAKPGQQQANESDGESRPFRMVASTSAPARARLPRSPGARDPESPLKARSSTLALARLRLLVEQRLSEARSGVRDPISRNELVDALARLQQQVWRRRSDLGTSSQELRGQLGQALRLDPHSRAHRVLSQADESTIDTLALLFKQVLSGPRLPEPFKVLFARLQIPILRLALHDASFFQNPSHPARKLLNQMAQAVMGWTDGEDGSPHDLYTVLNGVVERILADTEQDPDLYARAYRQLHAELGREGEVARTWAEKARQVAESRARTRTTDQIVNETIRERLNAYRNVPVPLLALLEQGWSRVLATAYERGGCEGQGWRDGLAMVDQLLWSVHPKITVEERRELLRIIPSLLRKLRLSLADSSADPRQIASWFKDLQVLHLAALRGDGDMIAIDPSEAAEERPGQTGAEPGWTGPRLLPGTWIQLRRNGQERARMKLLWQDREGERFLFVDRRGRRAAELTGQRLARLFDQGLAQVIGHDDDAIIDEAARAILDAIDGDSR